MWFAWIGLVALLVACDSRTQDLPPKMGSSVPGPPPAEPIAFRFAPPDGTEYVETSFSRLRVHCENLPSSMFEIEQKVAVKITRSESGFAMTAKQLSGRSWYNGSGFNDPYLAHLVGRELIYRIDASGKLVAVDGARDLERWSKPSFSMCVPTLIGLGNASQVFEHAKAQWSRDVGALAGATIAIRGGAQSTLSLFSVLSGRSFSLPLQISVPRLAYCPAARCVLVWLDYQSTDTALADATLKLFPLTRTRLAKVGRPIPPGAEVKGQENLVIDPDTLLIYREDSSHTTIAAIDLPGSGRIPCKVLEESRSTFDYSGATLSAEGSRHEPSPPSF